MGIRIQPIADVLNSLNLRTLVNQMARQLSDNTGSFTMTTGTTTTVTNRQVFSGSTIDLIPTSSASSTTTWWIQSTSKGQFIVGHPAGAAGRTWNYVITGIE